MNWRTTLTLLLVAGVLCLFFVFFENKQPGTRELAENAKRVFVYDRSQVDGLTITDHDSKIELYRANGDHWAMKSPLADRADGSLIDQLFTDLELMRQDDNISGGDVSKNKLAEYGLQNPRARLLITPHGGKPTELLFGNQTAVDGKTYLQLAGTKNIYVVNDDLKKLLGKGTDAWRDHRLTDLVATDVTKLVVKNSAGEIEFQRDGDHWKIIKPLAVRADDAKVNDLIAQVTNLNVKSFTADDKADAATYGLSEPRGVVTLFTAKDPKGSEIMIGNPPAEPKKDAAASPTPPPASKEELIYVRMPARHTIYTVPIEVESFVDLKPGDLRDRQLVHLNPDTVDRIHVTPGNGAPFVLARKEKAWTLLGATPADAPQPANGAEADRLMQSLNAARVVDFVADSASDLSKYGLDKPALQLTFTAYASENTAESAAGEKPVAIVNFGKVEGNNVYARLQDEPYIVSVEQTLFTAVPTTPIQWQPTHIFNTDPQKLTSVEIKMTGRPDLRATRADKGATWALTDKANGPLDPAKLESLVTTLARLHAMRWVGEVKPEYGFEAPKATLVFAAGDDAKAGGKLTIGANSPEGYTYAKIEGQPGAFVINRPDSDTLTQPLVPLPANAAATPTATPTVAPATPQPPTETIPPGTPMPTALPSTSPTPSISAATPVVTPTASPSPTATVAPAPVPEPVATPVPVPVPPPTPAPTATPEPTATAMPVAAPTPEPTAIPTPVSAQPSSTPAPETAATSPNEAAAAMSTPAPTASPMMTPADVPAPAPAATPETPVP